MLHILTLVIRLCSSSTTLARSHDHRTASCSTWPVPTGPSHLPSHCTVLGLRLRPELSQCQPSPVALARPGFFASPSRPKPWLSSQAGPEHHY
ncbi:hypothetical protein EDB19DRAFT_492486 [Suillus lakei]|nr:hypothetical protein EDB19DRAFT_492486 [Suillus lakei]